MAAGRAGGPQIPPRITEEPTNVTVLRNEPVRRHIFYRIRAVKQLISNGLSFVLPYRVETFFLLRVFFFCSPLFIICSSGTNNTLWLV